VLARQEEAVTALDAHRQELNAKREALTTLERELSQKQEHLHKAQTDLFATAQQLSRARNEINTLDLQKQGNMVRLEKLASEKVQVEEEKSRLEARLQEFAANVENEKATIAASRGTVEERQKRLRQVAEELFKAGQALDQLLRQQAEKKSRMNVLEQLQHDYEGFSGGAQAILKGAQNVLGTLTDRIRVPDQHIAAVETALGNYLQMVLVEDPAAAQQIIAGLTANKKGRASIAALSLSRLSPAEGISNIPEGVISALSVIEAEESVQPLLQKALGRTCIAPNLEIASQALQQSGGRLNFVTPAGEALSSEGIFTGGSGNNSGKPASSILARKNQIKELQTALAALQDQVNEASKQKGALGSEQSALQASLQQAQTELRSQEVAIATRQGEFNALQNSLRALGQKIETVAFEHQRLTAQEQAGVEKRDALAQRIVELENSERTLQGQVAEETGAIESLRQGRDAANTTLTETKVALATAEQQTNAFRQQRQALDHRVKELEQLVQNRQNEVSSFVHRKVQFESEISDCEQRIEALTHQRTQVNEHAARLAQQKQQQEASVNSREENLREQRRRASELQGRKGSLEVELAQKNMSCQNLRQRVQEKYQLNLDDIRSECITITIADEGPAQVETLTPEQMAQAGAATDWNAVAEQVSTLQKRVDEMGPVNLVAIEEYEETEQRYQFLTAQHDDLVQAKQQLLEVINKINTQTREMFTETFNKIRDNFRTMFTEIFGGGKADLVLVNEGDVLESGIDIVARPPGKQLQSISLLSGGEQTMTAVALLFSIYQVKPSPFCVLDELDAPLDESNINRFIKILQRFLTLSQFIIITHNKRTIGMADVLYGVTMEEHGVSKIVSVKFHRAAEPAPDAEGRPLVPPPAPAGETNGHGSHHQNGQHEPGQRQPQEVTVAE
jgi:chromosome segregation protein